MSARSLNKVMLIGNLTRDPELRYTPNGTAVCSFRVATNRSWMPSDGNERKEETEFHRIVAWNKLAELCSQLLGKGRKVYVEGRLQTRSWETPEGEKRYATEVVAEDMVILDSRRGLEDKEEPIVAEEVQAGGETKQADQKQEDVKEQEGVKVAKDEKGEKPAKSSKEKGDGNGDTKQPAQDGDIDIDDIPF